MLLLGGGPDFSNNTDTDGATYDPAQQRWQHIEPPIARNGDSAAWRFAVPIGGARVLAWSVWTKVLVAATSSSEVTSGADMFTYDETTNGWTRVEKAPGAFEAPAEVLWTGKYVLVRGQIAPNCSLCRGPGPRSEATSRYDPNTNKWTAIPADPLETPFLISAWTGEAMFSYDADSQRGPIKPGDASVYDPATDTWTQLVRAPQVCGAGAVPVWTGHQVLMLCTAGPVASGDTASGFAYTPGTPGSTEPASSTTFPAGTCTLADLQARGNVPMPTPEVVTKQIRFGDGLFPLMDPPKSTEPTVTAAEAWRKATRFGFTTSPRATYELLLGNVTDFTVYNRPAWLIIGHHVPFVGTGGPALMPGVTRPPRPPCSFVDLLQPIDAATGQSIFIAAGHYPRR
jgi:hypothetical protein